MDLYGTTSDQLGAIAWRRQWAVNNEGRAPRAADARGSSSVALPLRAAASLRLLSRLQRRVAVVVSPPSERGVASRPSTCGVGQGRPGDMGRTAGAGSADRRARSGEMASPQAGVGCRHRRPRAVRLLHVHRARDARGLRLLREGRGRPVRRGRQARTRRLAADEHRRRRAQRLLHVGHDAAVRRRDPGARPRRLRQVAEHDLVLVTGNGGMLDYHSTIVLSPCFADRDAIDVVEDNFMALK